MTWWYGVPFCLLAAVTFFALFGWRRTLHSWQETIEDRDRWADAYVILAKGAKMTFLTESPLPLHRAMSESALRLEMMSYDFDPEANGSAFQHEKEDQA